MRPCQVNLELLIIVEGIERVGNDYYWWGGNLAAAGAMDPVRLKCVESTRVLAARLSGKRL